MAATNDMSNTPNILGRYSIKDIVLELCIPIIMNRKNIKIPPKYTYIRNLIPVILDLHSVQYSYWSTLFLDVARANNLLHHINPSFSIDNYTTLWCEQDAVVLTWIYATISPYLLTRLLTQNSNTNTNTTSTSAMEAWARLRDICQQHDTVVQKKRRRFIHIDLNEDYRGPYRGPGDEIDLNEDYRGPGDEIDDDRVDLISNLPDELLVHILDLANDVKTAGRTSILSKRWISLWTDLMDLNFEDIETTYMIKYSCYAQPEMDKFVDSVNHVIAENRAPYLGTFRVHFLLNDFYVAHIENWLKFAFVKKVRNLELNFFNLPSSRSRDIQILKIFSTNPASILNTTLESLHLKSVSVETQFLQWVITNCLNLQSLSLHRCNDASSKHRLKLVVSSLKLKHLEFFRCLKLLKIDSLQLSAPNLTSFIYNEPGLDVEYRSVPSLVDVTFGGSYHLLLKALSGFSSQLEKLSIVWDEMNRAPSRFWNSVPINSRFPTFANVQKLEIISSQPDVFLHSATSLIEAWIEACPLIHTFKLKLMCQKQVEGPWNSLAANKTQLKITWNLKTVEYLGYAGCSFAADLALCLIRVSPKLRRFVFDTRQPQFVGKPCEVYTSDHWDQMKIARSKTKLLAERIRRSYSHVDVVIL